MDKLTCAVITPNASRHESQARETSAAVERAIAHDKGPFSTISFLTSDDTSHILSRSEARNRAVKLAADRGFDWILFLDASDLLLPSAFAEITDPSSIYSAIWGMIVTLEKGKSRATIRQPQYMIETARQLAVLPPFATLQSSHFVRTDVAQRHPFDTRREAGEDLDYFLRIWEAEPCIKLHQPLLINRNWLHSDEPRSVTNTDLKSALQAIQLDYRRTAGIDAIEAESIFQTANARTNQSLLEDLVARGKLTRDAEGVAIASFAVEDATFRFVVDNPLDVIQNHFVRDRLFEYRELRSLREHVPPGSRILDVGANVGNHLAYFVKLMGAEEVTPIEPNPDAIRMLRQNLALNGIDAKVRTDFLGIALGAERTRCAIGDTPLNNLGATWLRPCAEGEIEVVPLDQLPLGRIDFLKIDVEGMEIAVLKGAGQTVRQNRPLMYIEVISHNLPTFHALRDAWGYRIVTEFRYDYASDYFVLNYLLRPT